MLTTKLLTVPILLAASTIDSALALDPPAVLRPTQTQSGALLADPVVDIFASGKKLWLEKTTAGTSLQLARLGDRYEIWVHNPNDRGVLAQVAADGLSVFSGKPPATSDPGYIIKPGGSVAVRSWRRGDKFSAAFRFTNQVGSHAHQIGRGQIGIIEVWFIEDRVLSQAKRIQSEATLGARNAGTAYGEEIVDAIRWIPFQRGHRRSHTKVHYYLRQTRSQHLSENFVHHQVGQSRCSVTPKHAQEVS